MMLFDQHDAEDRMFEIASQGGARAVSLHCLTATSALCAFYELATINPLASIAVSLDGVRLSPDELQILTATEVSGCEPPVLPLTSNDGATTKYGR